jgi:hypothetical protein
MNHVTQKLIEVGGHPVEVKARIEKNGWVVIVFTPTFSIRSTRLHLPSARNTFINAIICSSMGINACDYQKEFYEAQAELDKTIKLVTGNFNVQQES